MTRLIKLIPVSLLLLCLAINVHGQDAGDLPATTLDLSRTYQGGSARIQALGGAQTALGGDISSASSNPAGLGFFNRSEFSFSPTFNYIGASSEYLGQTEADSKLNFNFANLGVVINKTKGDIVQDKWRGGSFGFSINRIADFHNQITYQGDSFNPIDGNGDLMLDPNQPKDFIEYAVLNSSVGSDGELIPGNVYSELAYEAYLIDAFAINNNEYIIDRDIYVVEDNGSMPRDQDGNAIYIPAFPEPDYPTKQTETINSKGGVYKIALSYGGNYNDRIYIGGGLGILSLDKDVERIYTEVPTLTTLQSLQLIDNHNISGLGINATLGLIARPINPLLLGISYTTPSYYTLEQKREIILEANYLQSTSYRDAFEDWVADYPSFNYNITTPSRLRGGATYFFGKHGFITGDVERVNYAAAKLSNASDGYSVSDDNGDIDRFESVFNYNVGGEVRFNKYRVRVGYSYQADPNSDDSVDQSEGRISSGAGIRTRDYFVDLGVIYSLGSESTVSPYPNAAQAEITRDNTMVTFSVGFFF